MRCGIHSMTGVSASKRVGFARMIILAGLLGITVSGALAEEPIWRHGAAMHGEPRYPADFTHYRYADPAAPKGGSLRMARIGSYDNLNPYILKGVSAPGLSYLFETLMDPSSDEAFSQYGRIAQTVRMPEDRSWVSFRLRPQARFQDGQPITAEDVIFSFETIMEYGHPFYRSYFSAVESVEESGPGEVTFRFKPGDNRELPLIIGSGVPVLSKAYWSGRDFSQTTLEPPVGSGPYRITAVDPGRSITYERDPDYWGKDLAVNAGRYNFDRITYDLYRDQTVALEAFKAGDYDFRSENASKTWATGYNFPAREQGLVTVEEIVHANPTGMQGYVFNTRQAIFADPQVREALSLAFDFEWSNRNLFYDAYTRTQSYFSNSELAATGLPEGKELAILEPYRDRLPVEVFEAAYQAPSSANGIRNNLRLARRLLQEAGWEIRDGILTHAQTGMVMEFEILLRSPLFERITNPFRKNLERLGITTRLRTLQDDSQYQKRMENFDFDMAVGLFPQSLSPGNEQADMWSSDAAQRPGSRNIAGVSDPVIDGLVEEIIAAPDREGLIARTRALDRVLLWGHYVIPHYHIRSFRVAYWDRYDRPAIAPDYSLGLDFWWFDPARAARIDAESIPDAHDAQGENATKDMADHPSDSPPADREEATQSGEKSEFTWDILWLMIVGFTLVAFLVQIGRRR